jgi:hypothetical protein
VGYLIYIALVVASFAAWLNHIIYCFSHEAWGFLIAGAIFFPIGIFHGIYLWF